MYLENRTVITLIYNQGSARESKTVRKTKIPKSKFDPYEDISD